MTSDQGEAVLKLNGRASGSTHESIVNPVVIQNDASNVPNNIYELKVKSFRLCQEGRPIGVYYADLKAVWQELDQRRPIKMELVRREAQRHATMMGGSAAGNQGRIPLVAMVTRPLSSGRLYGQSSSTDSRLFTRENKDDFKCTFCGQTRHMKDTCFQTHGVPEWFLELKKKFGRRPPMVATTTGNKDVVPTQGDPSQALLTRFNPNEFSSNTGYKCYHSATHHMYITMDVTFSESEYFYTPISPPYDHKGVSSSCDLDGVSNVHGVPSDAGYDTRSPYAEPVASRQQVLTEPAPNILQLIAKEETANPCVGATERECTDDQPTMAEASPLFSSTVSLSNASSLDIPEGMAMEEKWECADCGSPFMGLSSHHEHGLGGDDSDEIIKLEKNLSAEFEMKGLGDLKYFLGVEVTRSSKDQEPVDKGRYQKLVGRLVYLAHTHPDIAYAVSVVSQFMHSPSVDHMPAVMRILAYLKSAPGKGILYKNSSHLRMEGFTDADWAGDVTDSCFTSGYFTFVGGNLVTWRSKKQNVVSRSLAEAEFRGMAHGICEVLWLHKLLGGLGFKAKEAISLYCDNKSAREIAENLVQHDRTEHVEVDRHFIKEKLEKKIMSILFVNSEEQLADILTHAVCSRVFGDSLVKLGMCDIYSLT
ncbi:S9-RNase [Pyrus ussuriensis x Pyrus communis]|uniref:S9-RNase n=1 Tax=Pyrus ussuriensis x Pyrus communis TaxID=2448454 RepID=A0A5N5EUB7_9ROSA|nr:S9-RNase [Pyrus ussuriensis x Pyrus communis]